MLDLQNFQRIINLLVILIPEKFTLYLKSKQKIQGIEIQC